MGTRGNDFTSSRVLGLPVFVIRHDDVAGSWKEWYDEFDLGIRVKEIEMGVERVGSENVSRFTPDMKKLILFKCIGAEGRNTLAAEGITIENLGDQSYENMVQSLRRHYNRAESLYVRTQKFVTVRQNAGEDYSSYLLRVEKLSRSLEFFSSRTADTHAALQGARTNLALVLAVNGLRDQALCKQLIATPNLTWESLGNLLRAASTAEASVDIIKGGGQTETLVTVKKEVEVNAISRSRQGYRDRGYSRSQRSSSRDSDKNRDKGYSRSRRSSSRDSDKNPSGQRDRRRSSSRESGDSYRKTRYYGDGGVKPKRYTRARPRSSSRESGGSEGPKEGCYICARRGHTARVCPKVRCYRCEGTGHMARDCGSSRRSDSRAEYQRSPPPKRGGSVKWANYLATESDNEHS